MIKENFVSHKIEFYSMKHFASKAFSICYKFINTFSFLRGLKIPIAAHAAFVNKRKILKSPLNLSTCMKQNSNEVRVRFESLEPYY